MVTCKQVAFPCCRIMDGECSYAVTHSGGYYASGEEHDADIVERLPDDASESVEQHADEVNHPAHYTSHPSGVECITITEHFNFNLGNALKYLWRAGLKTDDPMKDLNKAAWYVRREIARLENLKGGA